MPESLPCMGSGARTTLPPNTWPIAWWLERHRLVDRDLVVAVHGAARPEIAQEVDEVVGKAVVVIDQQKHGTTPSAGGSKYRRRVPARRPPNLHRKCRWKGVHGRAATPTLGASKR